MTPHRAKHRVGARSLVWLLLLALALLGLTTTRQQALGPLHLHADHTVAGTPSALSAVASRFASDWHDRWRQQQMFGHAEVALRMTPGATRWPPGARTHNHDALERHHHALGDASVLALDGAAQAADTADGSTTGALVLLPVVALPDEGLTVPMLAATAGAWPVDGATAFASRPIAPPLRPPTA